METLVLIVGPELKTKIIDKYGVCRTQSFSIVFLTKINQNKSTKTNQSM